VISHWTSPEGRKASEKMGPIEFHSTRGGKEGMTGHLVVWAGCGQLFAFQRDDGGVESVPDTIALALRRDHARQWLVERRIFIINDAMDYDEALITAVNSTEVNT